MEFKGGSCLGAIGLVVFLCTLVLLIIGCIYNISHGIALLSSFGMLLPWPLSVFLLFISVVLVAVGNSPPLNCTSCGGENTLIEASSPMGQKILQVVSDQQRASGRFNDGETKNEDESQSIGSPTVVCVSPAGFCTECGAPKSVGDKFCHKYGKAFNQS